MPVQVSYPGVYIEEVPSGVRTITGVSTSVTAFVGSAKRGPINKAVRCLSFSDFERRFGGLDAESEMSYAVRQFFLNGGSEAWIVRLAKNATAASKRLDNAESSAKPALTLIAIEEGAAGNDIHVRVEYATSNPGSTFNLVLAYAPKDNPAGATFETHQNLSMNSKDPRFVKSILKADSQLVSAQRAALPDPFKAKGKSRSSSLSGDLTQLIDDDHNTLRISVDGAEPVTVVLDKITTNTIDALVTALSNTLAGVDVTGDAQQLVLTSKTEGETSSVRVLPGLTKDAASKLRLGPLFGGVEEDAVAVLRPAEAPAQAAVTSGNIVVDDLKDVGTAKKSLRLVLDGHQDAISIDSGALSGDKSAKLDDLAARIEKAVRARKPSNTAFAGFTATRSGNDKLLLRSGTRGGGSSLQIMAAEDDDLAAALHLLAEADTSAAKAKDVTLEGGTEDAYKSEDAYPLFIADRSKRHGIYALETVDLFNLLVLPGVIDSGILMDAAAYCKERRAFLIADSLYQDDMAEMEKAVTGTALPKTDYAAVYFPWITIADPLNGGRPLTVPPCGTIAGLYARTDSARGVWKAPAGTEATLMGAQAVSYPLTDGENGTLNPLGVNCLRVFPVYGAVAWGARTLRGADQMTSEYRYIPIRRLALYIEESLYRGTKWVVFEPNDEPLWAQIRLNIGAFMHDLFRQGAFQGKTPRDAYFVKCDKETTTQSDINRGIVNIVVGFAPLKPAEFVIIKIQQMAGQIEV